MVLTKTTALDYTFLKSDTYGFFAFNGPFGNCQNFSINQFNALLDINYNYTNSTFDTTAISNALYQLKIEFNKPLLVIDILKTTYDILESMIHNKELNVSFIVHAPYVNTTGSDMVLCIVDLQKLEKI